MRREIRRLRCHERAWEEGYIDFDTYHRHANEICIDLLWDLQPTCHYEFDYVEARHEDENLLVTVRLPVKIDSMYGEAYVSTGTGMIEYHDGDEYIIAEDLVVEPEVLERQLPDVDQRRRDAARERRAREHDFRRSVL